MNTNTDKRSEDRELRMSLWDEREKCHYDTKKSARYHGPWKLTPEDTISDS